MTNHVPVERCRHQAAGSFGSAGDKRLPSSTEVPLGHCLPASEGQVPCYEYKMLFSSPHTPPHTFCDGSFLSLGKCVSLWDLSSALLL